jgi:hypothetical protein
MPNKYDPVAYRNPTIKDLEAIRIILSYPALTAHEYMLKCYEPEVSEFRLPATVFNNVVLYTRAGRDIAEKGGIAIFLSGRKPRWYYQLTSEQQRHIQQRTAEEQVPPIFLDPSISEARMDDALRLHSLVHRVSFATGQTKIKNLMILQDVIAAKALESHHYDLLQVEMSKIQVVLADNTATSTKMMAMLQSLMGGQNNAPQSQQIEMQIPTSANTAE